MTGSPPPETSASPLLLPVVGLVIIGLLAYFYFMLLRDPLIHRRQRRQPIEVQRARIRSLFEEGRPGVALPPSSISIPHKQIIDIADRYGYIYRGIRKSRYSPQSMRFEHKRAASLQGRP